MTQVKICGITNLEDAQVAVEAGADLLGFIFYEPSPRYVPPKTVQAIVTALNQGLSDFSRPQLVGVFVNTLLPQVDEIVDYCGLDAVQLHGEEPPEFVNHFEGRAYKALRPQSQPEAAEMVERYLPCTAPPRLPCYLLDAYHPRLYGGTGRVTDWSMTAFFARQHRLMLAGSLTPANVAEAIQAVAPWGVDVSSGVEREKGKKDHHKVRIFIETVKSM